MSFNVRLPLVQDGPNAWENRRALLVQTIASEQPDIIGTQELHKFQGDYIVAQLPKYAWFGIDRRGGHADEHMGIFYRRDRLRVLSSGNFWLSDTPRVPGSITWKHLYPRMVTWALMQTRSNGRRFYFFNTHLPYRPEDSEARLQGARLLSSRIAQLTKGSSVIVAGDFNTEPNGPVHALLTRRMIDVRVAAPKREGPDGTYHAFGGKADRRIDWILARGFTPLRAKTVTARQGDLYPSDHFPVTADLAW
jgi:endonuclease/exonuclease/phosphatase family metal-dependent hydrolase